MKSLLLFTLLAAVLAVSLGKKRGGCNLDDYDFEDISECSGLRQAKEDDHVYRFFVGEDFGPYAYLNEEGYLKGFYIDLLMAVCKKAGKTCAYLTDTFDHCWHAEGEAEFPGVGLLDGYYDACIGFLPSPDRLNSFNFTLGFNPNVHAALYWNKDDESADHKNLTGRTIGVIEGWALSVRCLKRNYDITGDAPFKTVFYKSHEALIAGLSHHDVDAILGVDIFDYTSNGFVADGPSFECTPRGLSVMAHYYSSVIPWWNCAFRRLQNSGEFKELCENGKKIHADHGTVTCV